MPLRQPAVYILASKRNGTLYVGVTGNLAQRAWQHREKSVQRFTQLYAVNMLVYFEMHQSMEDAIFREKQIKKWKRAWKLELVEKGNRTSRDLSAEILESCV